VNLPCNIIRPVVSAHETREHEGNDNLEEDLVNEEAVPFDDEPPIPGHGYYQKNGLHDSHKRGSCNSHDDGYRHRIDPDHLLKLTSSQINQAGFEQPEAFLCANTNVKPPVGELHAQRDDTVRHDLDGYRDPIPELLLTLA